VPRPQVPVRPDMLPVLSAVKDAKHDDLGTLLMDLVGDDVGQPPNRPFVRAGSASDMTQMRKFTETIGCLANTTYYP